MMNDERRERRIAVLIDAENVSTRYIKLILDEFTQIKRKDSPFWGK